MILLGYVFTLGWIGISNLNFSTTLSYHLYSPFPRLIFVCWTPKNTLEYLPGEYAYHTVLTCHSTHSPLTHPSFQAPTRNTSATPIPLLVTLHPSYCSRPLELAPGRLHVTGLPETVTMSAVLSLLSSSASSFSMPEFKANQRQFWDAFRPPWGTHLPGD